jgi:dienelactone hydrolase/guanyl-specific ribonuclease Sa
MKQNTCHTPFLMLGSLIATLWASAVVAAPPVYKPLAYLDGDTKLEAQVVQDPALQGKRPVLILAHEQGPASPLAKLAASKFAALGYLVFSADLYGKDVSPANTREAAERLDLTRRDRKLVRNRGRAALAAVEKLGQADMDRVVAVGYGTGGTAMLELARSKADLQAVACVHGDLTPTGSDGKNIGASVLVVTGSDDPLVPLAQIASFEDEMREGGVDWQILRMGGVAGDFTNPQAGSDLKSGRAYDADADQRSFDAIKAFLADCLLLATAPGDNSKPSAPATRPTSPPTATPRPATPPSNSPATNRNAPEKFLKVLDYVDKNGQPMPGYEGGRNFGNFERRLPQTDRSGKRIRYREWDVNPLRPGVNRGAERLITGSDGSAHYTLDHYDTFKKIR